MFEKLMERVANRLSEKLIHNMYESQIKDLNKKLSKGETSFNILNEKYKLLKKENETLQWIADSHSNLLFHKEYKFDPKMQHPENTIKHTGES